MDFMSYSNYHLVDKDPSALLDPDILLRQSEKTFQTFFKHFTTTERHTFYGTSMPAVYDIVEPLHFDHFSRQVNGTLSERIEILVMNETATWLSLTIIFLLIVILIILIVSLQIVYPSTSMQRHVECLADVLLMVAGSDGLLRLVHERGVEGLKKSDVITRVGLV
jgi:hypothetical protein